MSSKGESLPKKQDISSFVLSPFTKKEKPKAEKAIVAAAEALQMALDSLPSLPLK